MHAERLADLAHGKPPAIANDGGGQPGAVAAVTGIDILNDLLAPLMLEIDVDVGRLLAFGRDEALEQEIDLGGVHIGDSEAVADRGIGGRASALAEDAVAARIVDDVVDGEEIARVIELGDQRELFLERVAHLGRDAAGKAPSRALPGQIFQMRLRGLAWRHRLVGIFVFQFVEGEGAGGGDLDAAAKRVLMAGEQTCHVLRGFDVALGIGFKLEPCFGNRAFLADAGEHVLQGTPVGGVIEHRIGGDERDAGARGEIGERCDAGAIVAAITVPRREIETRLRP